MKPWLDKKNQPIEMGTELAAQDGNSDYCVAVTNLTEDTVTLQPVDRVRCKPGLVSEPIELTRFELASSAWACP